MVKIMNLKTTGEYPCQFDDLIDKNRKTYATIYTLKNAREYGINKIGISKGKYGIFNIVKDVSKLTKNIVRNSLTELSKITGIEYKLI